jgi:hypothetical protein
MGCRKKPVARCGVIPSIKSGSQGFWRNLPELLSPTGEDAGCHQVVYRRHGNCEIIQVHEHQQTGEGRVRKGLATALVFALTVNLAIVAAARTILGQGKDPRSIEKREALEVTKGGAKGDQSKWAQYSPRADGSLNSKRDSKDFDSSADDAEAGMNPTIAIFLGLSVLLVIVVAAVAASRDIAKRQRKLHT